MEAIVICIFCIFLLFLIATLYGVAKEKLKEAKRGLQEGEKIDTIIHNNSNISDDEWFSWLQNRRDK